jgi:hypothetical protein
VLNLAVSKSSRSHYIHFRLAGDTTIQFNHSINSLLVRCVQVIYRVNPLVFMVVSDPDGCTVQLPQPNVESVSLV